jgi:hypothetical protein
MAQAGEHPSARRLAGEGLPAEIVEIHTCRGGTYGDGAVDAAAAIAMDGVVDLPECSSGRIRTVRRSLPAARSGVPLRFE